MLNVIDGLVFFSVFSLLVALHTLRRARLERTRLALEGFRGGSEGAGNARRRRPRRETHLPKVLSSLERRASSAGVDLPLSRVALLTAGAALGLFLMGYSITSHLWVAILASFGGLYAPVWFMERQSARRAAKAVRQLEEACQGIAQPMRAGASLQQALIDLSDDLGAPLGPEFSRVVHAMQFSGTPLIEAVRMLEGRIRLPEMSLIIGAMRLHLETGADLPKILDGVLQRIRDRRETRGAMLAATAQGRMQSTILMILPFFLLFVFRAIYPPYLNPLFDTTPGQIVFAFGCIWQFVGFRVMRAMLKAG